MHHTTSLHLLYDSADDALWELVDDMMNTLLPAALGVVGDMFTSYAQMSFGLVERAIDTDDS